MCQTFPLSQADTEVDLEVFKMRRMIPWHCTVEVRTMLPGAFIVTYLLYLVAILVIDSFWSLVGCSVFLALYTVFCQLGITEVIFSKFRSQGKQPCAHQHCFFTKFILYINNVSVIIDHHQDERSGLVGSLTAFRKVEVLATESDRARRRIREAVNIRDIAPDTNTRAGWELMWLVDFALLR